MTACRLWRWGGCHIVHSVCSFCIQHHFTSQKLQVITGQYQSKASSSCHQLATQGF